jgi:hypothetical protein
MGALGVFLLWQERFPTDGRMYGPIFMKTILIFYGSGFDTKCQHGENETPEGGSFTHSVFDARGLYEVGFYFG